MKLWLISSLVFLLSACAGPISPSIAPVPLTKYEASLHVAPLWNIRLGKGVGRHYLKLSPVLDGDVLYVLERGKRLAAVSTVNGKLLWSVLLDAYVSGGLGDAGEMLLLGADADVIAIDKGNGQVRWRLTLASEVQAVPVMANNVVVARSVDGRLYGLAADSGVELWRFNQDVPLLSLRGSSTPVISDDVVVAGFANGRVVALELETGKMQWQVRLAAPRGRTEIERLVDVDAELQVADGIVYASSYQGRIAAFTLGSGRLLWSREFSSASGISLDSTALYISDDVGDVWALDRRNGRTLWKQDALHGRVLSAPVQQGNALLLGDYDGYLHWMSREDGHLLVRTRVEDKSYYFPIKEQSTIQYRVDRGVLTSPVVTGDFIYAMDKRGVLAGFRVSEIFNTH